MSIPYVYHQHDFTENVALMLVGEWVSPKAHPYLELSGGWGAYSMKLINLSQIITNKSTKRPHFKSSDSEPEIIYQNTPTYMVIQSTEDIPINKIFLFKIEQIFYKQIKPTTISKINKRNNINSS